MDQPRILVSGIPRCGTAYMFRSLAGDPQATVEGASHLLKSHTFAPSALSCYKAVFMFGDPVIAAISAIREGFPAHMKTRRNLQCFSSAKRVDIVGRDSFHYEQLFDSWNRYHGYPALLLRYETCYKYGSVISAFVGQPVKMLPWHSRRTTTSHVGKDTVAKLRKTYASLSRKIAAMPNWRWWHELGQKKDCPHGL